MSRDAGTALDDRLITYLASGGAAIVARVVDGSPDCALARGIGATGDSATLEVFGAVRPGDRVSVHTLGEAICAIAGEITTAKSHGTQTTARVAVLAVKDDRPPGLAVVPFELLADGVATGRGGAS